jgi:hypothetical protein
MSEQEISLSKDGLTLKGEVVNDVRQPIKRLGKTADTFLRLVDNVVGLPADFMSHHLETFRSKYVENLQTIPEENRCDPNFRLGCAVLKNVAYSAEEPDIQALFASLLASSSDQNLSSYVHPGFASVINEMTSLDSKVLLDFYFDSNGLSRQRLKFTDEEQKLIPQARSNLTRLGLLDLVDREYNQQEINKFTGSRSFDAPRSANDVNRVLFKLINDHQKLKESIAKDRISSTKRQKLEITQFGSNFLSVVYKK